MLKPGNRLIRIRHVGSGDLLSGTLGAVAQVRPPPALSQKDMTIPVVIMIGREITMSALREWAAASGGAAHRAVKVNTLGKFKTALQARARLAQARRIPAVVWHHAKAQSFRTCKAASSMLETQRIGFS